MLVNADLRAAEAIKRLVGYPNPSVAEIGVFKGDMSRRLLYRLNLNLLMVDAWGEFNSDSYKASEDPMATMQPEEWAEVKAQAIEAVKWASDRVRMYQGTSEEAASEFDEQFDLVFIDAAHDYDNASRDIELWWPKVAPGGYLGGHDYRMDKAFGVVEAVSEFSDNEGVAIQLGQNYTWWAQKPYGPE